MGNGTDADTCTLDGTWLALPADDDLRRRFVDDDIEDAGWERVTVPGHWRSHATFADLDGPLLYRTRFDAVPPTVSSAGSRQWLTLDGVFYTSDVWLDGAYLGDTEGYFFPHTFEVTDHLTARHEHHLALEVGCTPQTNRTAKRNLTGVFQHWDLIDQDWNPGGIWRPVRIESTGPVRIAHLKVLCRRLGPNGAEVFIRAVLDSDDARDIALTTTVSPRGEPDHGGTSYRRQSLAAGENRVEWTVTVPDPDLWWPHRLGGQPLYDVRVEVALTGEDDKSASVSHAITRTIGLRSVSMDDWIVRINGERLFLHGANQGPTRFALADATPDEIAGDVALAVDANLDFLRIHAHVARPELYDAADEAGLLLWQDMPLQWGYDRSVRRQARRQARELVDLVGHHPSVFVWCGHNEPMAIDVEPTAMVDPSSRRRLAVRATAANLLPTFNRSVLDHSIASVLSTTDGSRPVVAHSGVFPHPPQFDGTDTHLYFGWYFGEMRGFGELLRRWPRLARFVTEFGAQAAPLDAPWLEPERWPHLDWDAAHRRFALQRVFFDRYVPPDDYPDFRSWAEATQRYQAELIRYHVETLRRLRYRPTGGFAMFCFADSAPGVTWSVLDHLRRPKQAYAALARACAPVIVVATWPPEVVHAGDALSLDLHVINDTREPLDDLVVKACLSWGDDVVAQHHTWSWGGAVGPDDLAYIATLVARVPEVDGALDLVLELEGAGAVEPARYTIVVTPR